MKQPLILSLVITLLSGIYGYHLNAQESINPLVLYAKTVTLKALSYERSSIWFDITPYLHKERKL